MSNHVIEHNDDYQFTTLHNSIQSVFSRVGARVDRDGDQSRGGTNQRWQVSGQKKPGAIIMMITGHWHIFKRRWCQCRSPGRVRARSIPMIGTTGPRLEPVPRPIILPGFAQSPGVARSSRFAAGPVRHDPKPALAGMIEQELFEQARDLDSLGLRQFAEPVHPLVRSPDGQLDAERSIRSRRSPAFAFRRFRHEQTPIGSAVDPADTPIVVYTQNFASALVEWRIMIYTSIVNRLHTNRSCATINRRAGRVFDDRPARRPPRPTRIRSRNVRYIVDQIPPQDEIDLTAADEVLDAITQARRNRLDFEATRLHEELIAAGHPLAGLAGRVLEGVAFLIAVADLDSAWTIAESVPAGKGGAR